MRFDARPQIGLPGRDRQDLIRKTDHPGRSNDCDAKLDRFSPEENGGAILPTAPFALFFAPLQLLPDPGGMLLGELQRVPERTAPRDRDANRPVASNPEDVSPGSWVTNQLERDGPAFNVETLRPRRPTAIPGGKEVQLHGGRESRRHKSTRDRFEPDPERCPGEAIELRLRPGNVESTVHMFQRRAWRQGRGRRR